MANTTYGPFIGAAGVRKIKAWARGLFAAKADVPSKTSELENDSNFAANVIESVSVNDSPVAVANKGVNISVPTDNSQLANGAGYQTASDVSSAIAGKADSSALGTAAAADTEAAVANDAGLPTGAAVKTFVENKGYQTEAQVGAKVESYGYQTADDVSSAIGTALGSVYTVKGSVATYEDLPSNGRKTGDVYNVVAAHGNVPAGTNYVFDGSKWDELGGTVDLSGYVQSSELSEMTGDAVQAILDEE